MLNQSAFGRQMLTLVFAEVLRFLFDPCFCPTFTSGSEHKRQIRPQQCRFLLSLKVSACHAKDGCRSRKTFPPPPAPSPLPPPPLSLL